MSKRNIKNSVPCGTLFFTIICRYNFYITNIVISSEAESANSRNLSPEMNQKNRNISWRNSRNTRSLADGLRKVFL